MFKTIKEEIEKRKQDSKDWWVKHFLWKLDNNIKLYDLPIDKHILNIVTRVQYDKNNIGQVKGIIKRKKICLNGII
ncbi:MAG: hypothetical protein KDK36_12875 [Leptospiraceae bacterium]|nr:hypothetical protein [Leptospiraceae bacterium]